MNEVAIAFAAVIGILLGALGGGGSILTVPVLVYALGFDAKQAIAISLPLVGLTSLVGAIGHWRAGHVLIRPALRFGVIAMAGAYLGARLGAFLPGAAQLTLLAVVMVAAAISMLRPRAITSSDAGSDMARSDRRPVLLVVLVALAIGALTGLVGIGGGFLFVPALVLLAGIPMRQAVGTSLVVIAMNAGAGFVGYIGHVPIPWGFVAMFVATASAGILGGVALVRVIPQRTLQRAFGVFLLAVGGVMLYQHVQPRRHTVAAISGHERGDTMPSDTAPRRIQQMAPGLPNAWSPLPDVITAGQPTAAQLEGLGRHGYRVVVDLRAPDEARGYDEPAVAQGLGLQYVNIPVTGSRIPEAQFDQFRQLLRDRRNRPVLVHCASANRVGALLLPYLVLDERASLADAVATAERVGLRSQPLREQAVRYVEMQQPAR